MFICSKTCCLIQWPRFQEIFQAGFEELVYAVIYKAPQQSAKASLFDVGAALCPRHLQCTTWKNLFMISWYEKKIMRSQTEMSTESHKIFHHRHDPCLEGPNFKTGLHAVLEATHPIQSCKSIHKFATEFVTNSLTFRVLWVFFGSLRRFLFVLRSKLILHRLCHSSDDIPREMHPGTQLRRNLRRNFKALKTDPIARPWAWRWAWSAHPFARSSCETKKKFFVCDCPRHLRNLCYLMFVPAFQAEFLLFAVQIWGPFNDRCERCETHRNALETPRNAEELVVAGHASKQQVTMTDCSTHLNWDRFFTEMRDMRCEVSPENAMDFRPPNKILTLGSPEEVVAVRPCKNFMQVTSTNKNCYEIIHSVYIVHWVLHGSSKKLKASKPQDLRCEMIGSALKQFSTDPLRWIEVPNCWSSALVHTFPGQHWMDAHLKFANRGMCSQRFKYCFLRDSNGKCRTWEVAIDWTIFTLGRPSASSNINYRITMYKIFLSNALCVVLSKVKTMYTHERRSLHWTLRATDRLMVIFQCTCTVPSQSIFLQQTCRFTAEILVVWNRKPIVDNLIYIHIECSTYHCHTSPRILTLHQLRTLSPQARCRDKTISGPGPGV